METLRIPRSTYRVQLNGQFTFKQATALVHYFKTLGISDLYASPILKATPGSQHGYDVIDCSQLNPEIGTEEELAQLSQKLKENEMGFLLDIVPNHMSIVGDNKWWQDVLENGPASAYAHYFNINWNSPKDELKNKVLLPVLDKTYGQALENQEIQIYFEKGGFFAAYKSNSFPLNPNSWLPILKLVSEALAIEKTSPPFLELLSIITALSHLPNIETTEGEKCRERHREKEMIKKRLAALVETSAEISNGLQNHALKTINGIKHNPQSFNFLEELLEQQAYRLSYWEVTNDEINYHRFFDINALINMRVEFSDVFREMHALLLSYLKKDWITGFRIDHVDGLFDPQGYFNDLQMACAKVKEHNYHHPNLFFYLIVEKILGKFEKLRSEWLVFGTTGYEALNLLNGLFIAEENSALFRTLYADFVHKNSDLQEEIYLSKKLILNLSMASELHFLAIHLEEISEHHRMSRDYTLVALRAALQEVIACFSFYRTYIRLDEDRVHAEDRNVIQASIQQAKKRNGAINPLLFDFIESVLLLNDPPELTQEQIKERRQFVMHFQQLTGPVTAKGVEDTAFYRYYPLASLNEVGMDPSHFGIDPFLFHEANLERQLKCPYTLLTTFTHDTKRSEDVRARINVLSEIPNEWKEAIHRWRNFNQIHKRDAIPDSNKEYLLYQTLVGSWPLHSMDHASRAHYTERIENYMIKACKEAKLHTSWISPNKAYEEEIRQFVRRLLNPEIAHEFLNDFENFVKALVKPGLYTSLSQTLLKITAPGIPDFYQGSELWNFTLVDPDNRNPVDFDQRQKMLDELIKKSQENSEELLQEMLKTPENSKIKMYLTTTALNYRLQNHLLFQEGDYLPLEVEGQKKAHVIAFARCTGHQQVIVVAGRFYKQLLKNSEMEWFDTQIIIPEKLKGSFQNLFTGKSLNVENRLTLSQLMIFFPCAILIRHKILA